MTRRPRLDIEEMILCLIFVFWTILSLLEVQVFLNGAYRPIELDRQNLGSKEYLPFFRLITYTRDMDLFLIVFTYLIINGIQVSIFSISL